MEVFLKLKDIVQVEQQDLPGRAAAGEQGGDREVGLVALYLNVAFILAEGHLFQIWRSYIRWWRNEEDAFDWKHYFDFQV